MYAHTQETEAWINLLAWGLICFLEFIIFFIILPAVEHYWGFFVAAFFIHGIGYLWTARFYKALTVEESDDETSLRVYFPLIERADPKCLSARALERGVSIKYDNIASYRVYRKEPGSCYFTGAFTSGCCSDPVPVHWNINMRKTGGFGREWHAGHNMVEFQLKEMITFGDCSWFNDCKCLCSGCARKSKKLRIGTDDVDGLVDLLSARGVGQHGTLAADDGIALRIMGQDQEEEVQVVDDGKSENDGNDGNDGNDENEDSAARQQQDDEDDE